MQIITKYNTILALISFYHPGKFESPPRSQSWDILFTSLVTEQQQQKLKNKNKKAKTKDMHLHADRNMKIIHEYLSPLDTVLWGLSAKIYPKLILTFRVA